MGAVSFGAFPTKQNDCQNRICSNVNKR